MIVKTYNDITIRYVHEGRWTARYTTERFHADTSGETEEIAVLRLVQLLGRRAEEQNGRTS